MVKKLIFKPSYIDDKFLYICGIDEVAVGSGAGPVVAAAVILPESFSHPLLNDSKKMSKKQRNELYPIIMESAISVGIGIIDNNIIDKINILNATFQAMHQALDNIKINPDFILVDGNKFKQYKNIPYDTIVKGDSKIISIAAASIIAKVYRDNLMVEFGKKYPEYLWSNNSGYLTKDHRKAIKEYGITPLHRKTFISEELLFKQSNLF